MQIAGLLQLNQNSQKHGPIIKHGPIAIGPCQKVVPLYIGKLTTVFLFIDYIEKKTDHVRMNDLKLHFSCIHNLSSLSGVWSSLQALVCSPLINNKIYVNSL